MSFLARTRYSETKEVSILLKINMFSSADKVKGQGVGSAYLELIAMLNKQFSKEFSIKINKYTASDISHYHTIDPVFYLSTFFKKRRGKTVGYVHFLPDTLDGSIEILPPFRRIFNWYVTSFYKRMDEIVVVNPIFIEELVKIGIKREKVTYIPNFVSGEVFYEESSEIVASFKKELGYQEDDFIVLGAGQIQYRKGVDDFFELALRHPEIQFIWAGGFSFGKITDGYEKYKKVYDNPPKNLRFTGIIDRKELVQYYNLADVFLLPSYNELFPMSILEAFNCGTPVMLRDLDLYQAIIAGQYISTKDLDDMDQWLSKLPQSKGILSDYRKRSKAAAAYYSQEHVASLWYDYYTGLVDADSSAKFEID